MKSPFGQRAEICSKFGWTWEYLHTGIPWRIVIRMMADASWYEYDDKKTASGEDVIDCENMTPETIAKLKQQFS